MSIWDNNEKQVRRWVDKMYAKGESPDSLNRKVSSFFNKDPSEVKKRKNISDDGYRKRLSFLDDVYWVTYDDKEKELKKRKLK